ncbi:hypothetical protein J6590_042198 [Homalodisca vitripennis]|nr:hypothetical protein J6590_042198 [Homalodisca vitripennis]
MKIPLHLDCTFLVWVSLMLKRCGGSFPTTRSSSPTPIWVLSDEHDSRFQMLHPRFVPLDLIFFVDFGLTPTLKDSRDWKVKNLLGAEVLLAKISKGKVVLQSWIEVPGGNKWFSSRKFLKLRSPLLTLNLGTNGLKVTSEPPPTVGQTGCLQGQNRSAVTHPSSNHARRCLIWLSCDNHCTRYTTPLAMCHLDESWRRSENASEIFEF